MELQWEGEVSPFEAMAHVVCYELGFGGKVTELVEDPNQDLISLTVATRVLNCHDRCIITGTREEMEPTLIGIAMFASLRKQTLDAGVKKLIDAGLTKPMLLATGAISPLVFGRIGRVIVASVADPNWIKSEKAKALVAMKQPTSSDDDFFRSLCELAYETQTPLEEVMDGVKVGV